MKVKNLLHDCCTANKLEILYINPNMGISLSSCKILFKGKVDEALENKELIKKEIYFIDWNNDTLKIFV